MIMSREKKFYTTFFTLFWPLVLQNVINLAVNLADNIMLGAYSQTALSGATAVNQLQFILQNIVGGVGAGLTVLGTQYWGQKRTAPIKKLVAVAFWASLAFGAIMFAACAIAPAGVVRLFINDDAVVAQGVEYLNILKYS